jgi:glucose/arabinose dehydrogenase
VEQPGRIRIVENGTLLPTPFLTIPSLTVGGERGLLSMAFHPRYAQNGFFYVNYTDARGDTRVERYRVSADRNRADPASAQLVIGIAQPYSNHNGGLVAFGPDGKLYVGMGDGGGGGDPDENGQDPTELLGKMLRLDVDAAAPYAIPADNPFAGRTDRRPEIWAMGLRNPWRFSWDRTANLLFVADVGQNRLEEINVVPAGQGGLNYGWDVMEGTDCFEPRDGCDRAGLTLPAAEYTHADGCSVTGGFIYRGQDIPALRGHYFYADYCAGWIRSFRYANGAATDPRTWDVPSVGNVTSFGEDARGELYVLSADGTVHRITAAE